MIEFRQALIEACTQADRVVITSHQSPDDDSVSSTLATKYFLEQRVDAEVRIVYEGSCSQRWKDFAGFDQLEFVEDLRPVCTEADVVVFLDGNELSRFSDHELSLPDASFCIDHHVADEHPFSHAVIDSARTSTAEVLYEVLYERVVDKTAARYLLLGILGDTANFRYVDASKAAVFSVAKDLVEVGDIHVESYQRTYGGTQREEFEVFACLMGNVQIVDDTSWPTYAYALLSTQEAQGFSDEDISGGAHMFVSWLKGVSGIEWGFVLTPRSTGLTACSFRSVSVNVRLIAEGLEVGGGHDKAAGARFEALPHEALQQIQEFVDAHEPVLAAR